MHLPFWLRRLSWLMTKTGVPECRMRKHVPGKPVPCLARCGCIQARSPRLAALNDHMYHQGYPYGVKVLVKERWCFIEFHAVEPSLDALRKSYGTNDVRVHWIGKHAGAAPEKPNRDAAA